MYLIVVRFQSGLTRRNRRPESVGWEAVKDGGSFATAKGALTRRKVVARKYPRNDTAVQTPGGHLIEFTPALHPQAKGT